MSKGKLVIDISLIPLEADVFFKILKTEDTIFYDSRLNPDALPPYAIMGDVPDIALLDLANNSVKAKFDLILNKEQPDQSEDTEDKGPTDEKEG